MPRRSPCSLVVVLLICYDLATCRLDLALGIFGHLGHLDRISPADCASAQQLVVAQRGQVEENLAAFVGLAMLGKDSVQVADVYPLLHEVAVKSVERIVTKVVRLLDDCPYEEVLMLSGAADAAPAAGLPVLANLAPAAVPATALPSAFSKSSSHKLSLCC